ncbi:MAG: type I methionyl aminopeptidase [Myxococcota bacterium]|nr:type I methionyl aminopeptidase [Myxococcota bacterium]
MPVKIHTANEIEAMRRVGKLAGDLLYAVGEMIKPGVSTNEIDALVHKLTTERHGISAPLNYGGGGARPPFPGHCCTSVNEVVCHGIPDDRVLVDGDIVNVDVTPILPKKRGWHGDTSITYYVGEPSAAARKVVEIAREALEIGLQQVRPGAYTGDIGAAIQEFVEAQGCTVVRDYTGHGVGQVFHTAPTIHHYGRRGTGVKLKRGMIFTVEPMVNLGGYEVDHLDDHWTVVTADGALTAQFEHTVVVTKRGVEILTKRPGLVKNSEDKPWSKLGALSTYPFE